LLRWHEFSRSASCYVCGSAPPPEGRHTKDHLPAEWLYPTTRRGMRHPTAPLCVTCKEREDPFELRLGHEITFRGGAGTDLWSRFLDHTLFNFHPRNRVQRSDAICGYRLRLATTAAGIEYIERVRDMDGPAVTRGALKLARGLHWILTGERLADRRRSVVVLADPDRFHLAESRPLRCFSIGPRFDAFVERPALGQRTETLRFGLRFLKRLALLVTVTRRRPSLLLLPEGRQREIEPTRTL